jgi:hypothetical protein
MVAAAIVGAAAVGAAGSAIAGHEAAGATTSAANTAANVQQQALAQQAQLAAPYTALGQSAIPQYQALLGIGSGATGPGSPAQGPRGGSTAGVGGIQQALQSQPGYQFAQQQGTAGTEAALNAQGLGLSGNEATALSQFNTGLAQQNYQQYLGDVQGAVGLGQAAAAGQASNIGTAAGNLSNIALGQGQNLAGIYANETAGITGALGSAANNYLGYQTLQNLTGNNPSAPGYIDPNTYGSMSALTNAGWGVNPTISPNIAPITY